MVVCRNRSGRANTEPKPASKAAGREPGPAARTGAQVLMFDALAGPEGVQAGAFVGLQLEQFQDPHGLVGRGHQPQLPVGGGQHHPGCGHAQQRHAAVGQPGEQLHHVEVIDQGVGQLDQHLHHGGLSGHLSLPPKPVGATRRGRRAPARSCISPRPCYAGPRPFAGA